MLPYLNQFININYKIIKQNVGILDRVVDSREKNGKINVLNELRFLT